MDIENRKNNKTIKTIQQITLTIYPQVELEMPMEFFILDQEQEAHTTIILQQTQ